VRGEARFGAGVPRKEEVWVAHLVGVRAPHAASRERPLAHHGPYAGGTVPKQTQGNVLFMVLDSVHSLTMRWASGSTHTELQTIPQGQTSSPPLDSVHSLTTGERGTVHEEVERGVGCYSFCFK